jgi:hypothetical protein
MAYFTLRIRDFRVLECFEWSPDGVCVLSGANGAGKSTTLDAFWFLRTLFAGGNESAFLAVDGGAFRRWDAEADTPVEFSLEVQNIRWTLRLPMSAHGIRGAWGEELFRDDQIVLRAGMFQDEWFLGVDRQSRDEKRCCAKVLWDRGTASWMQPLVDVLDGLRLYPTYWLNKVKQVEPNGAADSYLHGSGRNVWSVLANWKGSPLRYRGQFEWVMAEARRAFPGIIGTIEFDRGLPYLFRHGATDPAEGLLPSRAADGLLTGLLHLVAVAGARSGSLVAFDEVENHLHPYAIRSLVGAMRQQAEERHLTIVLTTHSPVVLNQFREEPEQVFVLGHNDPELPDPARMTDLHTDEWLAQAKLGTLYERLAFGAPDIREDVR